MEKFWLGHFGFRFDPFEHEEASSDPNLNRYLIRHDAFSAAWNESAALVFSPPGGGKTALRIYTARLCWTGGGGYQPFPIHYHLPHYFEKSDFSTLDDHLQKIVRSTAIALFLTFAYYPLNFLRTSDSLQKHLVQFIAVWIPDLEYYLEILRTQNQPDIVAAQIDKSYVLYQTPDESLLKLVCENFEKHLPAENLLLSLSIQKVFEQVTTWITHDLGFRSVYILLDGVDGFPELAESPSFAARSLFNLFANAPGLAESKIYIKGFLPLEIRNHLQTHLEKLWPTFEHLELKWDEEMLAEMIRPRIYAAVDGGFDTFGKVSAFPAIQDLELELARETYPFPREMLVLVKRILFEYDERWRTEPDKEKQLQSQDIEKALEWYRVEQAPITTALNAIMGK